jgi:hypothetical protein
MQRNPRPDDDPTMHSLRTYGHCGWLRVPADRVAKIKEFFEDKLVYNGHVQGHASLPPLPFVVAVERKEWPTFCVSIDDVLAAPDLFELALSSKHLAWDYFQEEPRLYSLNVFWTQPSIKGQVYVDTHDWHRDPDDRKQLVLFMYGEDVLNPGEGAHQYQRGTHTGGAAENTDVETILGPAGTVFLTDPSGLHRGMRPNKLRMLFWARWGVTKCCVPVNASVLGSRFPKDPDVQRMVRMVVAEGADGRTLFD